MARALPIDKVEIDFLGAAPEDRADIWADAVRPLYDVSPLGNRNETPASLARGWLVDKLVLAEAAFGGQVIQRHRTHFAASADALLIEVYLRGELVGDLAGQPVHIRPGEIHMIDFSRSYTGRSTPTHVRSLLLAHTLVGYDPGRHPSVIRLSGTSVVGHVFLQTFNSLFEKLDAMTKPEAAVLSRALISLIQSVLETETGAEPSHTGFTAARGQAVRRFIDQNLERHGIGAEAICAAFNISRSGLYREFKDDGGIERYIIDRRLDRALKLLAFGPEERGVIARTATWLGFTSTAHFSRAFRHRFGLSPSDVIGQHAGGQSAVWRGADAVLHPGIGAFLREL